MDDRNLTEIWEVLNHRCGDVMYIVRQKYESSMGQRLTFTFVIWDEEITTFRIQAITQLKTPRSLLVPQQQYIKYWTEELL